MGPALATVPTEGSRGSKEPLWWFEYAWPREWHYLEVWPCWSRCVTVNMGFKTIVLATCKPVFRVRCRTLSNNFIMLVRMLPYSHLDDNRLNL